MSARALPVALTLLSLCLACASARPTQRDTSEAHDDSLAEQMEAGERKDAESPAPVSTLVELRTEDGFRLQMPGQPQEQRQRVTIPAGHVETAAWSLRSPEGVIYSVSLADYPEAVAAARPAQDFLAEGRDGLANQLKGRVHSQRELTVDGHPGHGYVVSSEHGEVRARNFMVGRRLYTLLVLYNPSIGAPMADTFLESFALTRPVAPVRRESPAPKSP